jgi:Tfp pilus assembly protein FimV
LLLSELQKEHDSVVAQRTQLVDMQMIAVQQQAKLDAQQTELANMNQQINAQRAEMLAVLQQQKQQLAEMVALQRKFGQLNDLLQTNGADVPSARVTQAAIARSPSQR